MPRQYTLHYLAKKRKNTTQTRFITVKHRNKKRVIPITPTRTRKHTRTVATRLPPPTPLKRKPKPTLKPQITQKHTTPKQITTKQEQTLGFPPAPPAYVPKKQKITIEHKTKQETKLTHIERMHLYALCKKYDIDHAEIDHKITYDENKEYLEQKARQNASSNTTDLDRKTVEAEQWTNKYKDFMDEVGQDDERWKDYF